MGKALSNLMDYFRGKESKAEEKKEKKMSPAAYARGEKMEAARKAKAPAKTPAKKTTKK